MHAYYTVITYADATTQTLSVHPSAAVLAVIRQTYRRLEELDQLDVSIRALLAKLREDVAGVSIGILPDGVGESHLAAYELEVLSLVDKSRIEAISAIYSHTPPK